MPQIDLTGAGRLQFEPARDVIRMWPGVGGARIDLHMMATRLDERKDAPPCQVSAAMSVGRQAHMNQRFLCDIRATHLINPMSQATQVTLSGFITDHQLRVIEAIRRGAPLAVHLEMAVTCIDGEPGRMLSGSAAETFFVQSGEWAEALERADAGSYVELLVPLPANEQYANAVRRLRKARELMRDDQIEEALGEARKAIEKARKAYQTTKLAANAPQNPRQHTKAERWATYIESVFSLLSGAVHDDEGTTENFTWSRAEADALIVSVAGTLARLAEDEQ